MSDQARAASGRHAPEEASAVPEARRSPEPAPGMAAGIQDDYAARDTKYAETGSAAALGGTWLAAVIMTVSGLWSLLTGIAAVANGNFFVVTHNYTYNISITGWGWVNIVVGALVFAAGCALFARQTWARFVGIFLAAISAVMNFLFLPRYPLWAILIIALDVYIIWALTTVRQRKW